MAQRTQKFISIDRLTFNIRTAHNTCWSHMTITSHFQRAHSSRNKHYFVVFSPNSHGFYCMDLKNQSIDLQFDWFWAGSFGSFVIFVSLACLNNANISFTGKTLIANEFSIHLWVKQPEKNAISGDIHMRSHWRLYGWTGVLTPNVDSWRLRFGRLIPLRWALRSESEEKLVD